MQRTYNQGFHVTDHAVLGERFTDFSGKEGQDGCLHFSCRIPIVKKLPELRNAKVIKTGIERKDWEV